MDTDNTQDVIDVSDVIARFENLEASIEYCEEHSDVDPDEEAERDQLHALLGELKGNGGDTQWHGDWYPVTLIRDSYFEDYARELAQELYGHEWPGADHWPFTHMAVDWEAAAADLQQDYTSVDYDGITYWYR